MKFKILKIRMKISFSAFARSMTIHELFIKVIYESYYQRKKLGLILMPWPRVFKMGILKEILKGHESDEEDDDDMKKMKLDHSNDVNEFPSI